MNFLDLAKTRYTTKKYNPNGKITAEQIEQLKEILRLSPSSINSQPWKFIFVSDETTKQKLASASFFNAPKINDASHLVIFSVIDNVQKFEEQVNRTGSIGYYNEYLKHWPEAELKAWFKNQVYLSLGFFLAACSSMNIDSTPMEGIQPQEYDKILKLTDYKSLFAVALGYRNPEDGNQPSNKPKERLELAELIESI